MNHPDFPPFMRDKQPLESVLESLGFISTDKGYVRKWDDLEFVACEALDCWFLMRDGFVTKRTAIPPHDVRIFSPIAPIELLAIVYRLWAEVYSPKESLDAFLIWGKEWIDYKKEIKALIPQPPTIWAEREFLRHCLNYIQNEHDWVDTDYDIRLSQTRGQLRINAKEIELYCPARGNWVGETVVSAKALYRRLPKRFMGHAVMLQIGVDKLYLENQAIPARWTEDDAAQDKDVATNPGAQ